ncbi:MAG TPA: hypothetical protein VM053_02980 [Gemmatimonadaceae bacterium]|nr:hypothetical protein [Gemmatimonadaceae bacterium]
MPAKSTHPVLKIRLKRRSDGSAAITCEREDGSTTWQRQEGSHGQIFPAHDLTHYSVETTFGYTRGFFGLVADGWEISDFAPPWPRGPIPPEAQEVELLVGLLDMQRRMFANWNAEEMLEQGRLYVAGRGDRLTLPSLTDENLARVKQLRSDVFSKWAATEPGETLELLFQRKVNDAQD